MVGTSSNGARSPAGSGIDVEVPAKPKRRRFSIAEKARIFREADACKAGRVGAFLRREESFRRSSTPGGGNAITAISMRRR